MSRDVDLLARAPLPPRPGGYLGSWGPSPLWYAAASIRVSPFDPARHEALARQVPAQGPFVEVIHVSYPPAAGEHAESYLGVLQRATGAARFVEGRYDGAKLLSPAPRTLEELEQAFFRIDVEELSFLETPIEPWERALGDEQFLMTFGRARPKDEPALQDVLLVRPGKLPEVRSLVNAHPTSVRLLTLFEWVRAEPTRLSLLAARCPGEPLRQLTHLVLPIGPDGLDEKLFFSLLAHAIALES